MRTVHYRIVSAIAALLATHPSLAQSPAPVEFEVASVRRNTLDDRIVTINVGPGGRFAARGYTLVLLMQRAYAVMDWNVTGGPSWIRTDRFDVVAKANVAGDLTEAQLRPMLARLLADRFKLKLHRAESQISGHALQVASGGPKLRPSADAEDHQDTFRFTNTGMSGRGISMYNLARFFGGKLGLIVADETALPGLYDLSVTWRVDPDRPADSPASDPRDAIREAAFEALRTQLGLKIVAKKVTVETLVIDHVEKPAPSEN